MKTIDLFQRLWLALRLTWQGESVPRTMHGLHWDWLDEAKALMKNLSAISRSHLNLNELHFRFEGKDMPVSTFIAWWEHCIDRELPSLLLSGNAYALNAFHAQVWNLKDALLAWQATATSENKTLENAQSSLIQHCQTLPQHGED